MAALYSARLSDFLVVLGDVIDSLNLVLVHFSTSQIGVDLCDFETKDGKSPTNTSDLS